MPLLLTIAVAFVGAYLGVRLRIPAGALIGSMLAVSLFNICFGIAYIPPELKFYTQLSTGAYVGARITKGDVLDLRRAIKPAVFLTLIMLVFTIAMGLLIWRISPLSVATSLFSMAPAGVSDMTLASMDFDAQPPVVALIQTIRIIATVILIPPIGKLFSRRFPPVPRPSLPDQSAAASTSHTLPDLLLTLLAAFLFGGIGKLLGIPSGAISFSMIGCAAFNITTQRGYMPLRLRQFIQSFAGALVGCTVGAQQVGQILELYPFVILAVASFILLDIVSALVIARWTTMDLTTALFACAPGGITDMTLIAEDMGADSPKVAAMHTVRLVGVIATYPVIIHLIVSALGLT